MRSLKNLLTIGTLLMAISVNAQKPEGHAFSKDPAERAKMQTERMTEHLKLDEKQQEQIAAINLRYAEKVQSIHEATEDREATKQKIRKLKKMQDTEITELLDEKQKAEWEKQKAARKEKMQHKRKEEKMPDSK